MHRPTREELTPGMYNVIREPLVSREKVLLPPLHIKLGLVKQFVKAFDFEEVFQEITRNPFNVSQTIRCQNKRTNIRWSPNKHNVKV